jgi:hypothetical protein
MRFTGIRMHVYSATILACVWCHTSFAQPIATQRQDAYSYDIGTSGQAVDLLAQIIVETQMNGIPLGVIVEGDGLCKRAKLVVTTPFTITAFEKDIEQSVPGYAAVEDDGVMIVRPKQLSLDTRRLLELRIPQVSSHELKYSEFGIQMMIYIRAVLVPDQPSGYSSLSGREEIRLKPIHMQNASVMDIYNAAVKQRNKGVWMVSRVGPRWFQNPSTDPFILTAYPVEGSEEGSSFCSKK